MVKDIVDGYLGIMDLDLTNIPENLKKIMVEQHKKDIENYKAEQYQLHPHLRYENTVIRIQKMHHYSSMQQKTREELKLQEQIARNEKYNCRNVQNKKGFFILFYKTRFLMNTDLNTGP